MFPSSSHWMGNLYVGQSRRWSTQQLISFNYGPRYILMISLINLLKYFIISDEYE